MVYLSQMNPIISSCVAHVCTSPIIQIVSLTHCNTLQHTATHCNKLHQSLQHTKTPESYHTNSVSFVAKKLYNWLHFSRQKAQKSMAHLLQKKSYHECLIRRKTALCIVATLSQKRLICRHNSLFVVEKPYDS